MASLRNAAKSSTTPEHAPPPWTLKGDMYWLFLRLNNPLPSNVYHPLDTAQHSSPPSSNFKGGFGTIQIIRYSESPVGAYDELMLIPGEYAVPGGEHKGKSKNRVSRIYVNQKETCYSGRVNWNVPKHMARFEFSEPARRKGDPTPKELKVSVFEPGEDVKVPFFSATLTPASWLPSFPLSTRYLPMDITLVQPPLPEGEEVIIAGTDTWKVCKLSVWTTRACMVWVDVAAPKNSDDKAWPDVKPWSMGLCVEDATIDMAKPDEFPYKI